MAVILVLASAFVYWRVSIALGRQVDQDLRAYQRVVVDDLQRGDDPTDRDSRADLPGVRHTREARRGERCDPSLITSRRQAPRAGGRAPPSTSASSCRPRMSPTAWPTTGLRPRGAPGRGGGVQQAQARRGAARAPPAARDRRPAGARGRVVRRLPHGPSGARPGGELPARRGRGRGARGGRAAAPCRGVRDDELSRLGHTFNDLLARIEAGDRESGSSSRTPPTSCARPLSLMSTELEWVRHRPRRRRRRPTVLASMQRPGRPVGGARQRPARPGGAAPGAVLHTEQVRPCPSSSPDAVRDSVTAARTDVRVDVPDVRRDTSTRAG